MRPLTIAVATILALAPAAARADQCAWVPEATAKAAAAELKVGRKIADFCEPCGDKAPAAPREITKVAMKHHEMDGIHYWELFVNGQGIDLAYTFADAGAGLFLNVGLSTKCGAEGVSRAVKISP